jgi:hypothetical protein
MGVSKWNSLNLGVYGHLVNGQAPCNSQFRIFVMEIIKGSSKKDQKIKILLKKINRNSSDVIFM